MTLDPDPVDVEETKDTSRVDCSSRTALAKDLRIVADLLEKGDYSKIPDVLRTNLPQFLFDHVSRFVGKLTSDLLRS